MGIEMSRDESTWVLISPKGEYAILCFTGGDSATDTTPNDIRTTRFLNDATVFNVVDRNTEAHKAAIAKGFIKIPAYVVRTVTLGSNREIWK